MTAIIDILIYVAFAFIASSLAKKSENYVENSDERDSSWDRYLVCFVLFFAVIGGIRWNVGSDCLSYAIWFTFPTLEDQTKESLWWYFVDSFRAIGLHWSIGLGICAFVQMFFITAALRPYRWLIVFVPFVFFGGRYWQDCMGAVRQMIVGCGFLWASKFISERNAVKYMICIMIASMIHQSALILLPVYLLPLNKSFEQHRWKLIVVFGICIVIGQTPAFSGMISYVQFITGATNYDVYSDKFSSLLGAGETDEALVIGPMMLTYIAIPIFIIWYGPELKSEFADIIPSFNLWYNLAYCYACGYFLVCNISHLFIRPMLYFSLFQMVMGAMVLAFLWKAYKEYGLKQYALLLYCIVIFTNTAWDVFKASGRAWETTTYKVFLFHPDQRSRLNL